MENGLSVADAMALADRHDDGFFGGSGIGFVVLIFLFLLGFSGNGLFGSGGNTLTQANYKQDYTTKQLIEILQTFKCKCVIMQKIVQLVVVLLKRLFLKHNIILL
jgi:hypothetical protein